MVNGGCQGRRPVETRLELEMGLGEGCGWMGGGCGFLKRGEHLASQGFCLCVDSRCTPRSTPFPEILGLQFLPLSQLFFHVSKSGCSLSGASSAEPASPPNQDANIKNWPVNRQKCAFFTEYRWINTLLLTAATMGALSPAVPSWGHKSRRDGYAYIPGASSTYYRVCTYCVVSHGM